MTRLVKPLYQLLSWRHFGPTFRRIGPEVGHQLHRMKYEMMADANDNSFA